MMMNKGRTDRPAGEMDSYGARPSTKPSVDQPLTRP